MRKWVQWLVLSVGLATTATHAGTASGLSCGAIDGAESVMQPGTIVLLGEMHGTEEIPDFVADLVCSALDHDLSVTVALEIPDSETDRVAAYLDSDGGDGARAALLTGPFWTFDYQYGVSSEGEVGLIEWLRRQRRAGKPVEVVLLDRFGLAPKTRDAFLASRLADAAKASPSDLIVSLTGNWHNRTRKGKPWDADFEPMGLVLERTLPDRRVVALDVAFTGGTSWNCRGDEPEDCHAYETKPSVADGSGARRIVLDDTLADQGFDGYFAVGKLTASPPAARSDRSDGSEGSDEAAGGEPSR